MPPSQKIYENDRPSRGGGEGGNSLVKYGKDAVLMPSIPNNETIFCNENFVSIIVVLIVVYSLPNKSAKIVKDLFGYIGILRVERVKLIMERDFELSDIDWENMRAMSVSFQRIL